MSLLRWVWNVCDLPGLWPFWIGCALVLVVVLTP